MKWRCYRFFDLWLPNSDDGKMRRVLSSVDHIQLDKYLKTRGKNSSEREEAVKRLGGVLVRVEGSHTAPSYEDMRQRYLDRIRESTQIMLKMFEKERQYDKLFHAFGGSWPQPETGPYIEPEV